MIVVFLREPSKIAAEAHWANRNTLPITMDTSLDNANTNNMMNPFANSNGSNNSDGTTTTSISDDGLLMGSGTPAQKNDGLLLNLSDNFNKQNGSSRNNLLLNNDDDLFFVTKSNGKRLASEFEDNNSDDDNDLGPETDVDGLDDCVPLSPVKSTIDTTDDVLISTTSDDDDAIVNNNLETNSFNNPFLEKQEFEKATFEIDDNDVDDLIKQQSSEFDVQRSPREETPTPPADAGKCNYFFTFLSLDFRVVDVIVTICFNVSNPIKPLMNMTIV